MKIERIDSKKYVAFKEVKRGTFFEWGDVIYLKIGDDDESINAYNCRVNAVTSFGDEAEVTPLKAKVVIE